MYLVFFPTSGVCRKFDNFNLAQAAYPNRDVLVDPSTVSFKDYEEFFEWVDSRDQFKHGQTHATHVLSSTVHPKPRHIENLPLSHTQSAFWELARVAADSVTKIGRKNGYTVDLPRIHELIAAQHKMPGQALSICQFLANQEYDYYTKEEMRALCASYRFIAAIDTRQNPWRIFRYYRPLLTQLGVLK
jgi:hypothetical protein